MLRVIRKNNKYYVQRQYRFLFWTYWFSLDSYGFAWSLSHRMSFNDEYIANEAMEECADELRTVYNIEEIVKEIHI